MALLWPCHKCSLSGKQRTGVSWLCRAGGMLRRVLGHGLLAPVVGGPATAPGWGGRAGLVLSGWADANGNGPGLWLGAGRLRGKRASRRWGPWQQQRSLPNPSQEKGPRHSQLATTAPRFLVPAASPGWEPRLCPLGHSQSGVRGNGLGQARLGFLPLAAVTAFASLPLLSTSHFHALSNLTAPSAFQRPSKSHFFSQLCPGACNDELAESHPPLCRAEHVFAH